MKTLNQKILKKHEVKTRSLEEVIKRFPSWYDPNAPYQRNKVWSKRLKKSLIESILAGLPIGPVHLVPKEEKGATSWIIDGKQRLSSIDSFTKNEFDIMWDEKKLNWNILQKNENQYLLERFQTYQMSLIIWPSMSLLTQKEIFEMINTYEKLSTAEKIYCPNFLSQSLFEYIYKNCFSGLAKHARGEMRLNKRFSGIYWTHKISVIAWGAILNDKWATRKIDFTNIKRSAVEINESLCKYFTEKGNLEEFKSDLITKNVIEDLGYKSQINFMKKINDAIVYCIDYRGDLPKQIPSVDLTDIAVGFYKKAQDMVITASFIKENAELFHDFIIRFISEKKQEIELSRHTTDKNSIEIRNVLFNKLFDQLEIDKTKKNKPIPPVNRALALLKADTQCPITGEELTPKNTQIDHVLPKSKYGHTDYKAVSSTGNRNKSNHTENSIEKISSYMKS